MLHNVTIYSSTMDPMGGRFHRLASLGCTEDLLKRLDLTHREGFMSFINHLG